MDRFTSFDGVEIAYQTWGTAGPLPPVILHHGFIVDATINWVRPGVVTALTNAGRHVVALDARGHGASSKPHDPSFYGEEKMVQDLRHLFTLVGATSIDLVGYSMGAIVSLIAASQDARIRRLVVGGVGAFAAHVVSLHESHISLNRITAPTLVIAGDNDPVAVRPELLASSISNARVLLLPGDHLSVVSTPRFASAIVEFLAL